MGKKHIEKKYIGEKKNAEVSKRGGKRGMEKEKKRKGDVPDVVGINRGETGRRQKLAATEEC